MRTFPSTDYASVKDYEKNLDWLIARLPVLEYMVKLYKDKLLKFEIPPEESDLKYHEFEVERIKMLIKEFETK